MRQNIKYFIDYKVIIFKKLYLNFGDIETTICKIR